MEVEMKVADVMSRAVVSVMPGHSIWHAAKIMLDHHVSGLPVIDGDGHLWGMFTEGDLLRRVEFGPGGDRNRWIELTSPEGAASDYVRSNSWRVSDVMSSPAVTVREDTPLAEVATIFATRGIKHVPVTRDGRVVGVVSRADLLRVIAGGSPDRISDGDDALWTSAKARLAEAGLFAENPDVTVVNGVVHLWGTVRSEAERDAARVAVESVEGIAGVENHLTVRTSTAA
jgi:CBS domain-containing protein